MDELLTVKQVAELLQLHEMTIRRYIKSGKLEAVRIGRNVRVPRRAVEALLHGQNAALHEAPPVYQTKASVEEREAIRSETIDRIQNLRQRVDQLKHEPRNWDDETLWDDLDQVMDDVLKEALTAGAAIKGEWQSD